MNARWIALCVAACCLLIGLAAGCESVSPEEEEASLDAKMLTHASRQLIITDWTENRVRRRWGEPSEVHEGDFFAPRYGQPATMPSADRQWVYVEPAKLSHRLIWFRDGKVVLAVEEWSDF